ncbi:MAG TPA: CAP domain-containing protein [Solirubrobacteraceae bacterium]
MFPAQALAGKAVKAGDCPGQHVPAAVQDRVDFRAALLCGINAARSQQGLPALKRSPALEKAAQGHAADEAKRRFANHNSPGGSTIASRIKRRGYRAAAYNEALGLDVDSSSAYTLLREMVDERSHPCTAIFDPRFRDAGIGIDIGGAPRGAPFKVAYLVIDFGLRAGRSQPSRKTGPARTCPHKLPPPPFTGSPVVPAGAPATGQDRITVNARCTASVACAGSVTVRLPNAGVTSAPVEFRIPARGTAAIVVPVDSAAIDRELASASPSVVLGFDHAEPARFHDEFDGPLPPR